MVQIERRCFGFPDEWAAFEGQHAKFLEALDALTETINCVKCRTFHNSCPADEIVFFLGSVVSEDFTEVWLLAGNGLGTGAMKVLRGMYERTVTAAYISKFPEQVKPFSDYGQIAHRRLLNHAKGALRIALLGISDGR
jgi:hypothetical protein